MFFKKNTLNLDEVTDAVAYIALLSIGLLLKQGKFLNDTQRRQMWEKRKELYKGSCSNWHASKICVCADDLARHVTSNEILFSAAHRLLNSGKQEDKEEFQEEISILARTMVIERALI